MPAREQYAAIAAPALPLVGIAIVSIPSSLAIDTASAKPRALKEPVGNRPSSLTRISALGQPSGDARERDQRRYHLAERDHVLRPSHRQQLAIAPEALRPAGQRLARQRAADAVEIIPHQQR